jgi:hypothetical protein
VERLAAKVAEHDLVLVQHDPQPVFLVLLGPTGADAGASDGVNSQLMGENAFAGPPVAEPVDLAGRVPKDLCVAERFKPRPRLVRSCSIKRLAVDDDRLMSVRSQMCDRRLSVSCCRGRLSPPARCSESYSSAGSTSTIAAPGTEAAELAHGRCLCVMVWLAHGVRQWPESGK